jgi:hypothetical protein
MAWLRALVRKVQKSGVTERAVPSKRVNTIPSHWSDHPCFIEAHEVIALRDIIERALAGAIRSTRGEGEALSSALGELPAWPQYDESRASLSEEMAPIWWSPGWESPDHDDGIALFQLVTLRERAAIYGVKGRSKTEIAERLRAKITFEEADALAAEGRADWESRVTRRERRKFCEVLAHTVQMASGSIANVRYHIDNFGRPAWLRWTSGPCCKRCDLADESRREVGVLFPHVNVSLPPAHPGCSCVEIAATPR